MTSARAVWRRWRFGTATLLGGRRGYFIPSRYAAGGTPHYPALEAVFAAASEEFRRRLDGVRRYMPALVALGGPPPEPRFDQDWFPRLDAALAYTLVREGRPGSIVEIGSGHSTRFMARAIRDGGLATRLLAIDPEPRASLGGLTVDWRRRALDAVDADAFHGLAAGDILFVDSSHVLMPGSDVDRVLNDILPRLASGVLVHFHDVFLSDAYPATWAWRGYNEQNAVAGLLGSGGWRLLWSSHWVATRMQGEMAAAGVESLPLTAGAFESSLWLEKI